MIKLIFQESEEEEKKSRYCEMENKDRRKIMGIM